MSSENEVKSEPRYFGCYFIDGLLANSINKSLCMQRLATLSALWCVFLAVGMAQAGEGKAATAVRNPHWVTLIFYLTKVEGQTDADAISASLKQVKSTTAVTVNTQRGYVLVTFDSHAVSFHQVAQAIADAGAATGRPYDPRLRISVPEYSLGGNAAKVDAVFAGKRLNQRVSIEPLDKTKGEFLVRFLPLQPDPAAAGPQGFNGGHLNHPVHDAPPRGLGLKFIHASNDVAAADCYAGLRRSSYGLRKQNGDDAFWTSRAKTFAARFPGAQPLILHILSNYQDDGSTEIEFRRPETYRGPTVHMSFHPGKLDHERALAAYDAAGVKAVLQFEPGNADVAACFDLAHAAFARHACVIGLAIDGEWFRAKESADRTGLPITDADAQGWMEQVLRFNPGYLLVLKHFDAKHLPPTYRHPNLWFLTDSQEFKQQAEWMADMRDWATTFNGAPLGSQYGYPKDQKWWSKTGSPPFDLGRLLLKELPDYRMLLWVDFTADRVPFEAKPLSANPTSSPVAR